MSEERFSDMGKVEAVRRLFEGSPFSPQSPAGFSPASGSPVVSAGKLLLEGIDFNLIYFPLKHLGYKSVTAVTGDLYAALAHPRSLSVVLGVSAKLDFEQVRELWTGITTAAAEHSYTSLSLDLKPSRNGLTISLSASGETSPGLQRPETRSKDLLCVSGSLGGAFLGLSILERAAREFEKSGLRPDLDKYRMLVGSYLKPEISPNVLSRLEEGGFIPSLGCLVTEGLADAAKRLSALSGLGVKIYAQRIPFEGNSFSAGKELDLDPVSAAMNGGEDYRLLFVLPLAQAEAFRRDFQTFDVIGHLALPEAGTVLVTPEGAELPLRSQGWKEEND